MNQESGIRNKLTRIKLLLMDFDGVLTNGFVYVNQDGIEMVRCSRKDSLGTLMLQKAGIQVGVVSKETSPVVSARCKKMNIECWQGIGSGEGKADVIKHIAKEKRLTLQEIAFIGDDVNDIPALKIVGLPVTVADGHPDVKKIVHFVTERPGGNHAVREVCDMILQSKGKELAY